MIGRISGVKHIKGTLSIPTNDYNELKNKPSIESVILTGDIKLEDIGINKISKEEITDIIGGKTYGV